MDIRMLIGIGCLSLLFFWFMQMVLLPWSDTWGSDTQVQVLEDNEPDTMWKSFRTQLERR